MSDQSPAQPAGSNSIESQEGSSEEQSNEQLDAAPEGEQIEDLQSDNPGMSKKEAKQEIKRLKKLQLKVDGKTYDEELPFEIEDKPEIVDWMKKQLQMSKVASKRMGELSSLEKQVDTFVDLLKKDPRKILSDPAIGIDLKKFAASILEEEIANSRKSPEQIEREKLESELKELREQQQKEKEDFKTRELERLKTQEFERYDMLLDKALSSSDLPKSPYVVKKIADYMVMGLDSGYDVTPEDVLPLVREEIMNDVKSMFAAMPEDVIEGIVGKDKINSLRKKNVAKAKQVQSLSQIKDVGQKTNKDANKEPEKKINYKDYFKI